MATDYTDCVSGEIPKPETAMVKQTSSDKDVSSVASASEKSEGTSQVVGKNK